MPLPRWLAGVTDSAHGTHAQFGHSRQKKRCMLNLTVDGSLGEWCLTKHSQMQPGYVSIFLRGSSCMVKNEGKGRKMTGFKRDQKIVVLMDILKPSQTSMVE